MLLELHLPWLLSRPSFFASCCQELTSSFPSCGPYLHDTAEDTGPEPSETLPQSVCPPVEGSIVAVAKVPCVKDLVWFNNGLMALKGTPGCVTQKR